MGLNEDLIACDREIAMKDGLKAWIKLAWSQLYPSSPLVWNWHLDMLSDHYEAAHRGQIRNLVVNIPPGGSKSSITCVLFPCWGWIQNPERSWVFAAYGEKLIHRDARLSNTFMHSKWWTDRFGDIFTLPTVPRIEHITNNKGGFRLGTTPNAEVTGFHANYQVIDDPNKPEELTKLAMQDVKDWYGRTMATRWRRPPEVNSLICIMQRLHCDDLTSLFLEWDDTVHICLPAEYNPTRHTRTPFGEDPRRAPGELLDPIRLPRTEIARLRKVLGGTNAAAQLDQAPVPEGGGLFKRASLQYWLVKPPQLDEILFSWDCAFKDEDTCDFVVGQVWGRVGATFYLLDQARGHWNFATTMIQMIQLALRWRDATTQLVEDKANGTAIIETLEKKIPGIVAVDPRGGKFARASAASAFFEAGNVFLPDPKLPGYEWVDSLYIPELLGFPRYKNDDQVDATTQALLYLQEHTNYLKAAMEVVRKTLGFVDIEDGGTSNGIIIP